MTDQRDELIELYALGALPADEAAEVEDYLASNSQAQERYSQYRRISQALLWSVEQRDPPAGAYERFRERLATPSNVPTKPLNQPTQRQSWLASLFGRRYRLIATALTIFLVLLGGAGGRIWQLQNEVGGLQPLVEQNKQLTALLGESGTQLVPLADTGSGMAGGTINIIVNPQTGHSYLRASHLPPLAANQSYQLWLIADGTPQSMEVFGVDTSGDALIWIDRLPSTGAENLLGITVEPAGGSQQPTSNPLAVGTIDA
ncbi:anti-sigma factor [Herpetosiphon gulosus]|uniref:Regulator of SigK n=1 Tax=Herpetosiphon gulosus TaxID=1973496 RepID=A0ABP9X2S7_9CHLR